MSELQNAEDAWGGHLSPAPQSPQSLTLGWNMALGGLSSHKKRDRTTSFDTGSFGEGNQFAWGAELLADLPPQAGTWKPPIADLDRQGSSPAESADNSACLAQLQLQDGLTPLPRREAAGQFGSQGGVNIDHVSEDQAKDSAEMSLEVIQQVYTKSWGFVWAPKESKEKPNGAEEDLGAGEKWSVKTQAASIIRDLFRRPDAKRQAVTIEGGKVGFLKKRSSDDLASQSSLQAPDLSQLSSPESAEPTEDSHPQTSNPPRTSGHAQSYSGSPRSDAQNGGVAVQARETPVGEEPAEPSLLNPPLPGDGEPHPPETLCSARSQDSIPTIKKKQNEGEKDVGKVIEQAALRVAQALDLEVDAGLPTYYPWGACGTAFKGKNDMGGASLTMGLDDLGAFDWPAEDGFPAGGFGNENNLAGQLVQSFLISRANQSSKTVVAYVLVKKLQGVQRFAKDRCA